MPIKNISTTIVGTSKVYKTYLPKPAQSLPFKKDLFAFHDDMMTRLKKIKEIKQIKVVQANFETGDISVTTEALYNKCKEGVLPTYEEIIETVEFLRICENFIIRNVDFISGTMLVKWIDEPRLKVVLANLTQEEVDLLKAGKKVECIKTIRDRTGQGLNEAKRLMDKAYEYLTENRE